MTSLTAEKKSPTGVVLHPTLRTTTVVKTSSLGHILHEPVKCAVIRQPPNIGSQFASGHEIGHQSIDQRLPAVNKIDRGVVDEQTVVSRTNASVTGNSTLPIGTVAPMVGVRTKHRDSSSSNTPAEPVDQKPVLRSLVGVLPYVDSNTQSFLEGDTGSAVFNGGSQLFMGSVNQAELSSQTSAVRSMNEHVCKLEGEVNSLKDQLEVQFKVNTDLKKLLVASIGDDLHHKVDALVRTKIQLANEIDDYTKKLVEDYEDLDKISIQADIWHSKFKASRVLVDQLNADRRRLSGAYCEAQTALQHLLVEHHELHQTLLHCQRQLEAVQRSSSLLKDNATSSAEVCHTIGVAKRVKRLTDQICVAMLGMVPTPTSQSMSSCESLTPAEQLAHRVLAGGSHYATNSFSGTSIGRVQSFPLLQQFQSHVRFDGVTFNCCAHCKGEVRLV